LAVMENDIGYMRKGIEQLVQSDSRKRASSYGNNPR